MERGWWLLGWALLHVSDGEGHCCLAELVVELLLWSSAVRTIVIGIVVLAVGPLLAAIPGNESTVAQRCEVMQGVKIDVHHGRRAQ